MRLLLLLAIILAAGALLLPPRLEVRADNCGALEARIRHIVDDELAKLPATANPRAQSALQAARDQAPTGAALTRLIQDRIGAVPPEVGCAIGYWATIVQPDLRQLLPSLLPPRG